MNARALLIVLALTGCKKEPKHLFDYMHYLADGEEHGGETNRILEGRAE